MSSARTATRNAHRRYVWRVAAAMTGYLLTLLLAEYLIEQMGLTGAPAIAAVLVPALCVAAVFWALGRLLVEETDEYLRSLLVRQILVASGLTLTVGTLWGFLEDFNLAAHLPGWYIAPFFFFGLGVGALVNRLTVGDSGRC